MGSQDSAPTTPASPDTWVVDADSAPTPASVALPIRYEDRGLIGTGGMGEVRRVYDRTLHRLLAMKIVRAATPSPGLGARFTAEARLTAGLQHPGIVPVHDLGRLPDGRWFFTMREVRGRTLTEVIREVHAVSPPDRWEAAASGWTLRRLIDAVLSVCEAVAYAHARGVVHRDLKPGNVMVGEFGEVLVLDWGLARLGARELPAPEGATSGSAVVTRIGAVMGTPAYMAPEQRRGEVADARTDVYLLGGLLHEVFTGAPPGEEGGGLESARPIPDDLLAVLDRARVPEPADRYPDAGAMAVDIAAWLDGARKREQALAVVDEAKRLARDAWTLRTRAREARARAEALLAAVPTWEGADAKADAWAAEDEADAATREASLADLRADRLLHAAFTYVPDLPEAHAALGERHRRRHAAAAQARDHAAAAWEESQTRAHAAALPPGHPARARLERWLRGEGRLSLATEPPGALVELFRYVERGRRLVLEQWGGPVQAPLDALPLPEGSWLARLTLPGHEPVAYPVQVAREQLWDARSQPVRLPPPLPADERYVPAGPFWMGGDAGAPLAVGGRWEWVDGFVIERFPVTNARYLEFLDALVAAGREEEALRWAPRERGSAGEPGALLYGRRPDGTFCLQPDAEGDIWAPDWPVVMIDWRSARAFAAWRAETTGLPWRLPTEREWEKAARGVDGRKLPWGDRHDPSWFNMRDSRPGRPMIAAVTDFPLDESPYGVRGMAGNVRDLCADAWSADASAGPGADEPVFVVRRGGALSAGTGDARAAFRSRAMVTTRDFGQGFRLARSWP